MLGIIFTTQFISCQKMDTYKTEKFEWDGDATAPEGYPMWIIYPHSFILSDGYEAVIPNDSFMEDGWEGSGRSWSVGESNKAMPDSLKIAWYSYTEDKFYKGNFKMPQEKIYQLFKDGYWIYGVNWEKADKNDDYTKELHKETFSALTVGLAPKGMVVIWATGQNKIEIGRYQAEAVPEGEEADRMWKQIADLSDRPISVKQSIAEFTPEVREEVLNGKISSKKWDDYRLRYPWKVVFNQSLEVYDYHVYFFNSEKFGYRSTNDQASYNKIIMENKSKAVPSAIDLSVKSPNGLKHLIRIDSFDEGEIINSFKNLAGISPNGDITIQINVDESFKEMNVVLKNDFKQIILEKCKTKIFRMDKKAK
ncbi:DUF2931 family protein [Flavobacterium sp. LHD-80]|uniref:DUF2931 family protein n=1 Tax=Flavobacterium sp. LHD-80 TaxID=3071411 RepID=UPI0027DEFCC3|nr:DUF2931 family protein [Flavobacterium sp. LHD-80]MDQ6472678.1 DUF2931 family protein [Flavobacterium sp. LHD-80]